MWLRKDKGGCSILWRRADYAWPEDGSVCEVPEQLGAELLAIRGGGYKVVPEPEAGPEPEGGGEGDGPQGDGDPDPKGDDPKGDGTGKAGGGQDDATAKAGTGAAKPSRAKTVKPAA